MMIRPLFWIVVALLASLPVYAHENVGPAFSPPDMHVDMPTGWESLPIDRDTWADNADLAVTLDQHLYPALLPLINEYAALHGLDIAVQEGTCGISSKKLSDRQADIGGYCCPAGKADRLPGLRFHTLGIAALAIIVHPDNPLDGLSTDQARALFHGDINHWHELGQAPPGDGLTRPIGRLHCKARPGHWRLLLDNEDLFSPRLHEVSTIPDMVTNVARSPGAIGYETLWMLERYRDKGSVRSLPIDGAAPTDMQALAEGRYPFYRTYQITTWAGGDERAAALVRYIQAQFERVEPKYGLLSSERLRQAGWKFQGDELSGPPTPPNTSLRVLP